MHKITMDFDSEELKDLFFRWFIDGGGQYGFGTPDGKIVKFERKKDVITVTATKKEVTHKAGESE